MAKPRANTGVAENRTASDSLKEVRPIRGKESDALVARIKEIVGDESASSFARRCGFSESVLRGYLVEGKKPGVDYLVAIAEAGNVTVDWLATGRPPKTRSELRATPPVAQAVPCKINVDALAAIIEGAFNIARDAPPRALAAHCAKLYNTCIEDGLITPEGIGNGHLDAAA